LANPIRTHRPEGALGMNPTEPPLMNTESSSAMKSEGTDRRRAPRTCSVKLTIQRHRYHNRRRGGSEKCSTTNSQSTNSNQQRNRVQLGQAEL
jgi:hypothetical protein